MSLERNSLNNTNGDELISESTFVDVCNAIENILVNVNYSRTEGIIYEKLNRIRELIDQKISPGNILSESSSVSSQSICSNCSVNKEVENFMTQVYCPFCSNTQENEIELIKHLKGNCEPHRKKEFKEKKHIDFSTYVLLPSNKIKCNVCKKSNFIDIINLNKHSQDKIHIKNVNEVINNKRKIVLAVFCSCCEVLLNYSYKEITFHVSLKGHEVNLDNMKSIPKYSDGRVFFIFTRSRKFKCGKCTFWKNALNRDVCEKFISSHISEHHNNCKVESINSCEIYCEVCLIMFTYNDLDHFFSETHKSDSWKMENQKLKSCFFCGINYYTLMSLSNHIDSGCSKIHEIEQKL